MCDTVATYSTKTIKEKIIIKKKDWHQRWELNVFLTFDCHVTGVKLEAWQEVGRGGIEMHPLSFSAKNNRQEGAEPRRLPLTCSGGCKFWLSTAFHQHTCMHTNTRRLHSCRCCCGDINKGFFKICFIYAENVNESRWHLLIRFKTEKKV